MLLTVIQISLVLAVAWSSYATGARKARKAFTFGGAKALYIVMNRDKDIAHAVFHDMFSDADCDDFEVMYKWATK